MKEYAMRQTGDSNHVQGADVKMTQTLFHPNLRVAIVGRNLEDLRPLLEKYSCIITEDCPELVISYGGDGSLLGAERRYPGIPKCALRDSRENPKCSRHSERQILGQLFAGELDRTDVAKLECRDASGNMLTGINDITISRAIASSAIRYRIWADGKILREQVVADALLIATSFGSTGYFQSITHGFFSTGIGLAFNNSMDLLGFSVLPEETTLKVELLRGPAFVVADNDASQLALQTGDFLQVRILPERVTVFGIQALRCMNCYDLRKHGRTSPSR